MSRELPILFNTEMVRAILDGRKKCTRRIVKIPNYIKQQDDGLYTLFAEGTCYENQHFEEIVQYLKKPYQPGDILYVRETWGHPISLNSDKQYVFRADKIAESGFKNDSHIWYPSIHMPKEAARIWLKITDVRVERLQEITEVQAQAEGIRGYSKDGNLYKYAVTDDWWIDFHNKHRKSFFGGTWWQDMPRTAREAFSYLWNNTIKKFDLGRYGWDANPYVFVIEFIRIDKPEEI